MKEEKIFRINIFMQCTIPAGARLLKDTGLILRAKRFFYETYME